MSKQRHPTLQNDDDDRLAVVRGVQVLYERARTCSGQDARLAFSEPMSKEQIRCKLDAFAAELLIQPAVRLSGNVQRAVPVLTQEEEAFLSGVSKSGKFTLEQALAAQEVTPTLAVGQPPT